MHGVLTIFWSCCLNKSQQLVQPCLNSCERWENAAVPFMQITEFLFARKTDEYNRGVYDRVELQTTLALNH